MPKLRTTAETLVAGHDFSPQWPGVVRAVQEQWLGGICCTMSMQTLGALCISPFSRHCMALNVA